MVSTSVIGLVAFGALLFAPAGTFNYWQGWVFLLVFAASTQAIGVYLAVRNPALLERQMQFGPRAEQRPAQRIISALSALAFLGVIVFAALDHRFGWSPVPFWVSLVGDALVVLGLYITLLVLVLVLVWQLSWRSARRSKHAGPVSGAEERSKRWSNRLRDDLVVLIVERQMTSNLEG